MLPVGERILRLCSRTWEKFKDKIIGESFPPSPSLPYSFPQFSFFTHPTPPHLLVHEQEAREEEKTLGRKHYLSWVIFELVEMRTVKNSRAPVRGSLDKVTKTELWRMVRSPAWSAEGMKREMKDETQGKSLPFLLIGKIMWGDRSECTWKAKCCLMKVRWIHRKIRGPSWCHHHHPHCCHSHHGPNNL